MPIIARQTPCWELLDTSGYPVDVDGGGPTPHFAAEDEARAYVARRLACDDEPEASRWHAALPRQNDKPCLEGICGGCGEQLGDEDEATHFEFPAEIREMADLRDWLNDADDDLRCSTACTTAGLLARPAPGGTRD